MKITRILSLFLTFGILSQLDLFAAEPVIWQTNTRAEALSGEARGVSVSDTGTLTLAPHFGQVFNTEQAYIWSSAADTQGNIFLGTGHDGRIYRVAADGKGALFYDAAELDVTALVVGRDGALYAGTSPDGKVYRITSDGKAEVYFDPPDKYIWSLALMADGALAVGTGDNGKLYRVRAANAKPEDALLADTQETHVISLVADNAGNLYAGTDPGGLILRVGADGKVFALYDAPLREIHSLSLARDGSLYALGLSDAAANARGGSSVPAPSGTDASGVTVTVTNVEVVDGGQGSTTQVKSRYDLSASRSAVFHLLPDGGTDIIWNSPNVTGFAVAANANGDGALIGTADKGRIYAVGNDGRETLLVQSSEGQVSTFVTTARGIYAATSNQGKLFQLETARNAEGSFESSVRDAKLFATWGRIWWRGQGNLELQTRTGNTDKPDATWSDWSAPYRDPAGAQITSPRARFIQWRAVLRGSDTPTTARLDEVNIAYLPRNIAPEILNITILPVGIGLQSQVQVQPDPNLEISGLEPSLLGAQPTVPPRRLYQRGARALQWQAEDRNSDTLEYAVYYRALAETEYRLLKDKLRDNFYTVDGAALADGRYVFRIVATDAPDNPNGAALIGERTTDPVEIDNTPPTVRVTGQPVVSGNRVRITFEASDATGRIRHADVSTDGNEWQPIFPDDMLADSGREIFTLDMPLEGTGEHVISLRVFDSNGNLGSARTTVRR